MTPPKKWPENAEWARQDAVAALDDIHRRAREVQAAIAAGHPLEAMFTLTKIADKATAAKEKLNAVRGK